MIIQDSINLIKKELKAIYSQNEIESFIQLIFDHLLNMSGIKLYQNLNKTLSDNFLAEIGRYIESLKKEKPIQYILGETEFFSLKISVNPSVLIPRPETEELVKWIISDYKDITANIIDIGTGSGCIAIALKKNMQLSNVAAVDISKDALSIAKINAKNNNVNIDFIEADILKEKDFCKGSKFEVIVSNPPYVTEVEKKQMADNVLKFEPYKALFVPDKDALLFYREICLFAKENLNSAGNLYFEINEQYGKQVIQLLKSKGFSDIILKKDIEGKDRMIKATWFSK